MNKWFLLLPLIFIAGCTQVSNNKNDSSSVGLANPSAVYCINHGFNFTIRNETGYCIFPDGSECLSWDYYHNNCTYDGKFIARSPVSNFTINDINRLGVNCSGSDAEIAECIYDWQVNNMIYTTTNPDKGPFNMPYPIKWQEILPGIYNSKDVIEQQVTKDGKVYGICFDFAVVYCSIARYYGLNCRIMETGLNLNNETRPGGMSRNEYDELVPWMIKAGVNYSYNAVRLTMPNDSEVTGHYWAEVKLNEPSDFDDNGWRIVDASNKEYNGRLMTKKLISSSSYNVVNWIAKDKSVILANYTNRELKGEDLSRVTVGDESINDARKIFEEDVAAGRSESYTGITDDLGQSGRSSNIDDYQQGKGLAPYFNSCSDVCSFFKGTIPNCEQDCNHEMSFYNCYESCSNNKFYKVCDFICPEGSSYADCYEKCSGVSLNNNCNEGC